MPLGPDGQILFIQSLRCAKENSPPLQVGAGTGRQIKSRQGRKPCRPCRDLCGVFGRKTQP